MKLAADSLENPFDALQAVVGALTGQFVSAA